MKGQVQNTDPMANREINVWSVSVQGSGELITPRPLRLDEMLLLIGFRREEEE